MKPLLVFAVCSIILFSSCHFGIDERVRGNGVIKKENRTAGEFKHVDVSGAIDVIIKQGSERSVSIETDENLLPLIEVRTEGDRLFISFREGYNLDATGSIKAFVSSPVFEKLEASGACSITSQDTITANNAMEIGLSGATHASVQLKCPKLTTTLSGASEMKLSGEAKEFKIDASGSSHVKSFDLISDIADVDLSGASSADIYANTKIEASASGASTVRYKGSASINANTSGASNTKKVD